MENQRSLEQLEAAYYVYNWKFPMEKREVKEKIFNKINKNCPPVMKSQRSSANSKGTLKKSMYMAIKLFKISDFRFLNLKSNQRKNHM